MKILKAIWNFLFVDSPIYKMIISFIIFILSVVITLKTDIGWIFNVGLAFLGYTLIIFLIGVVYALIINPMRDSKNKN